MKSHIKTFAFSPVSDAVKHIRKTNFNKTYFLFLPDVLGLNYTTFLQRKFPTNDIYVKVVVIGSFSLFPSQFPSLCVRTYGTS